jgi:starch-binding outer membrane protein, SusD/RagB family
MKNTYILLLAGMFASSCTDLDVPIDSTLTTDIFPRTEKEYIALTGPVYTQMRESVSASYFQLQEFSTDEAVLTARGSDYYDGGRYMQMNLHTWNETHPFLPTAWAWGYRGINLCSENLNALADAPESAFKNRTVAEMRTMRALYYFMMMDLFGNVPLTPEYGSTELPEQTGRASVFNYIEAELLASIPVLTAEVSANTYGRPTQWMAHTLLAKLYLNSEVYTGEDRYTDAVAACNAVIFADANGDGTADQPYALVQDYLSIFGVANGPAIKEIIFAVPFDQNFNANGMSLARFPLHPLLRPKYGMPTTISVGNCLTTWSEFYALYDDPDDVRNAQWLVGPQYNNNGSPIMDGDFHVTFNPDISFTNLAGFDRGTDKASIAEGVRSVKYQPDGTWTANRDSRNDFVFFRYADVLLMKAEALLRGGVDSGSSPQTALELVNALRTMRNADAFGSVDLAILFEERSREMAYEGLRRHDLIRFGKWEDSWGIDAATGQYVKTNADTYRRVYPIPQNELAANTKLKQNDLYE